VLRRLLVDAGLVLATWLVLLFAELSFVAVTHRSLFAGGWEISAAATRVAPIALAALVPCALVVGAAAPLAARADELGTRRALTLLAGAAGAALGYGVTFGRHFASVPVRAAFVAGLALAAALGARVVAPSLARLARARPVVAAGVGLLIAASAWAGDRFVLPRLYPAFHVGLEALAALGGSLAACVASKWTPRVRTAIGAAALACGAGSIAWAAPAARGLTSLDNLRLVLLEQAPWLGRGVELAARIAPPPPIDGEDVNAVARQEVPRALDWTGRDVVLLTVDALRADHVSAYGYARPTTPEIDALARAGVLFTNAYCATPHTSYSVTSMMTGKYMRPLLELGLGADSETWAGDLRRYGYRTAAFYPPAVFFVDEQRFVGFRDRALDFEYRKIQFSDPLARAGEVERYLSRAPGDKPLFLWVHFFEPHEPYVMHDAHRFGDPASPRDVDAYDSEIAAADEGIGVVVRLVRAKRKNAVFLVSADHGEEFGEHGGRYHGTTVYEEQVHVPLVVVADGLAPGKVDAPVQTIDLLPTVLSALGIPRPPRVRGTDLGPLLARKEPRPTGFAFSETDEYARVVRGTDRLVCSRSAGACRLFDGASDPREEMDRAAERPQTVQELKRLLTAVEREHGRYESGAGADLPDALRRGMQGDVEAAEDVAALLDDAKVDIRREAAKVSFRLHAPSVAAQLTRAMTRDEDLEVRRWCALALSRVGPPPPLAVELLRDPDVAWRRRAALARAEQGDASVEAELVAWWSAEGPPRGALDFESARELLAALTKIRARTAAPAIAPALEDVRLRPHVVEALGAIGNPAAKEPLLRTFASERYVHLRPAEANALLALGATEELRAPLTRFAGVPEPLPGALRMAERAGLLTPERGGWLASRDRVGPGSVRLKTVSGRPLRLWTLDEGGAETFSELPASPAGSVDAPTAGVRAMWVVPRAEEIEPPPAVPWDAGFEDERLEGRAPDAGL
jgi:arylsulfatase A-like enzyme